MRLRTPLLVLGCLAAAAPASGAKGKRPTAPVVRPKSDLSRLQAALESGERERMLGALDEIERAADQETAPLVDALLARGASSEVLLRALEVDAGLKQEASSSAIAPYVAHRNPDLRRAAARALASTGGALAVKALRAALRGNDPALRGDAAAALGKLGAREAVDDLFSVLPHNVPEAAAAIGLLCVEKQCAAFVALLGKLPFDQVQHGFPPILLRVGPEISDALKINLIERVRRLATKPARDLLASALAHYPKDGSAAVQTALDRALHGHSVGEDKP